MHLHFLVFLAQQTTYLLYYCEIIPNFISFKLDKLGTWIYSKVIEDFREVVLALVEIKILEERINYELMNMLGKELFRGLIGPESKS